MLDCEPEPPNFDSMNTLAKRSPLPPSGFVSETPREWPAQKDAVDSEDPGTIQHQHPNSIKRGSRQSRRSIASLARERTSAAFANLTSISSPTSPSLRSTTSSTSLSKPASLGASARPSLPKSSISASDVPQRRSATPGMARSEQNKMHQTSSKVLRMTEDDRPITKEFQDLFATLITSLPLTPHRVRFTRLEDTFSSEEAITNLGSLKFSQSNRIPDPKVPSRWVVTTTTTTFSMAKEMARSMCQRFLDARYIESAENRSILTFSLKGGVWRLTPKGTSLLSRFCLRNGINARHVESLIRGEQMQLVTLERDLETDRLSQDKSTIEVIFRRFAGQDGPNVKSTLQLSDSDSVSEYASGLVGVKMAKERKLVERTVANSFTGRAASDWLMDCCTTVDRRETHEICEMFVKYQLITSVMEDRGYKHLHPNATLFQPTRSAIYAISDRGQRVCGWLARDPSISSSDSRDVKEKSRGPRDSNSARLNTILQDPALRLLFREFLRQAMCEENLNFYQDVKEFTSTYRQYEISDRLERADAVRELLGQAYGKSSSPVPLESILIHYTGLYNAFLASGAPSELNIDHNLRNRLDSRMIRSNHDDEDMRASLKEMVELFDQAQASVFKLMSSVSLAPASILKPPD